MRKLDLEHGVVYAYRWRAPNLIDRVVPLVFLAAVPKLTLRQDARGHRKDRPFKRAPAGSAGPRAGEGTRTAIGYPAAIIPVWDPVPDAQDLTRLRQVTLQDFDRAVSARQGLHEFMLVTNTQRVLGKWGGEEHRDAQAGR